MEGDSKMLDSLWWKYLIQGRIFERGYWREGWVAKELGGGTGAVD